VTRSLAALDAPRLHVKAESSLLTSNRPRQEPVKIGRELAVDAVVTGRVVRKEGTLALQAELIRVNDGVQLWGDEFGYQNTVSIGFSEDEIVSQIARHLQTTITEEGSARRTTPATSAEVKELMERANGQFWQGTPDSLTKCIDYCERVIEFDPTLAWPYGMIGSAYVVLGHTEAMSTEEAARKAKLWSDKAIRLDHRIYTSRVLKAVGRGRFGNWAQPAANGSADPLYEGYLFATGQLDELIAISSEKLRNEPDNVLGRQGLADGYYAKRDYAAAIEHLKIATTIDPRNLWPHMRLGRTYAAEGDYEKAVSELLLAQAVRPASGWLGYTYARSGRRSDALSILRGLEEQSTRGYVSPLVIAQIYLGLDDLDHTFGWLRKACDMQVDRLNQLKVDPVYDSIRSDPRYQDLLACVGLDQAALNRWTRLAVQGATRAK
jgi:tetratricopeptide (TPR) repeat protein